MAEAEASLEAPAWMLALEKKRQRVHRLAHEVGAGSPCLLCKDDCPGLDLHFWRKICRNCKCKKEDHNVIDDCGFEQFEILLGAGHFTNRPNRAFLEMLEKQTIAGLKNKTKSVAFDWVPPNVPPDIAAEYMQSLPASKLPISGSDGALYRRQQLERQLPLHDLDANQCHQLSDTEVENLMKYLENLKSNVVGQGRVTKLQVPTSHSLDSLQKACAYNSVPKPFQPFTGGTVSSNSPRQFDVGGHVSPGQTALLKPPSAFLPKSLSPEPFRSVSPSGDAPLSSVADRGAAFGVTLSPASGRRTPSQKLSAPAGYGSAVPSYLTSPANKKLDQHQDGGHIIKDQVSKSVAQSMNVPGSMWIPSECTECPRRVVDGHLVRGQVCSHVVNSSEIPQKMQLGPCVDCITTGTGIDGQLVRGQICSHIVNSSEIPQKMQLGPCVDCIKTGTGIDGQLVRGQICSHVVNSSEIPQKMQLGPCVDCIETGTGIDGQLVRGQICSHVVNSSEIPQKMQLGPCVDCITTGTGIDGQLVRGQICSHIVNSSEIPQKMQLGPCVDCVKRGTDGQLVRGQICSHIVNSSEIPQKMQLGPCVDCIKTGTGIDGLLVRGQICSHIVNSSEIPQKMQLGPCVDCIKTGIDGQLVRGQVCSHIANSSEIGPKAVLAEFLERSSASYPSVKCAECSGKCIVGILDDGLVCPHVVGSGSAGLNVEPGQGTLLGAKSNTVPFSADRTPSVLLHDKWYPGNQLWSENQPYPTGNVSDDILRKSSPLPPSNWNENSQPNNQAKPTGDVISISLTVPQGQSGLQNESLAAYDEKKGVDFGRDKSPTNVMSTPGTPHTMALYAHNALNSPSGLEPRDVLSPHVASMSIDDGVQLEVGVASQLGHIVDPTPPVSQMLNCIKCKEDIAVGEVVVFADRAGPEVVWHPQCFVCNSCEELLVDLVYFFNKGHVYCGRHYAEILDIPRCSACDELIFVKEYTVAEGQSFHVKHFCCFECDDPLGGKQYVPKDGQPICLPCYGRKFGKQCETCHSVIGAQDQGVSWKDFHWHATPACFCCSTCEKSLLGGRFAVKDQRPFCSKECMQAFTISNQKVSAV